MSSGPLGLSPRPLLAQVHRAIGPRLWLVFAALVCAKPEAVQAMRKIMPELSSAEATAAIEAHDGMLLPPGIALTSPKRRQRLPTSAADKRC